MTTDLFSIFFFHTINEKHIFRPIRGSLKNRNSRHTRSGSFRQFRGTINHRRTTSQWSRTRRTRFKFHRRINIKRTHTHTHLPMGTQVSGHRGEWVGRGRSWPERRRRWDTRFDRRRVLLSFNYTKWHAQMVIIARRATSFDHGPLITTGLIYDRLSPQILPGSLIRTRVMVSGLFAELASTRTPKATSVPRPSALTGFAYGWEWGWWWWWWWAFAVSFHH